VRNPARSVTFKCAQATPLDLIRAVGFQTRLPIGVALGKDLNALSKAPHSYNLHHVDARSALLKAVEGTGYSIRDEGSVILLTAGDLSPRQRVLLTHSYRDFRFGSRQSMVDLGMHLTMWMRSTVDPKAGLAMDLLGSTNDERFSLTVAPIATTEEIANQIVGLGSKGMWILRANASPSSTRSTDEMDIEPYQHHANAAVTNQP
jgi:hypothetical protein